jgi:hypothetical protein
MFQWFNSIGIGEAVANLRVTSQLLVPHDWLIYSFPAGAWTFTGTALMRTIWMDEKTSSRWLWICITPLLSLGGEIGQHFAMVPGRFDTQDLNASLVATALAIMVTKQKTPQLELTYEKS